ncbi:TadE/TadG family type IV pilus assembly protein [Thiorhodococcus minor]|uniref:Pilus assembly protein n=1 Tax=Thiorhodococcus minor TaxID=57489 RepID=A0A6M0JZX1_9GAMM|nr:TadE family protein [Thiorhodococcus minor]NEV63030.1 pilus assembly protein [Thiorhodococcus minor]
MMHIRRSEARLKRWAGRRKRQQGNELVAFALLIFPFLLFCFIIIDVSVLMFDQQILNQGARYAARQGTLFWIDPDNYYHNDAGAWKPNNPRQQIAVHEQLIDSTIDYFSLLTINPRNGEFDSPAVALSPADAPEGTSPDRIWRNISSATTSLKLRNEHRYFTLTSLIGLVSPSLTAGVGYRDADGEVWGVSTEADL